MWTDAELEPIDLHTARHTFASLMIAAGVNAKALSDFMGRSSIKVTFDLYGHLMPGPPRERRPSWGSTCRASAIVRARHTID